MKSSRFLVFALAFAVFFVGPAVLSAQLPGYPLMKIGDAFDLLTPLILIPLYWGLWTAATDRPSRGRATVVFLVVAALWVLGHGMHLAANSIGHQLEGAAGTDAYELTSFYDEVLSHYLWHLGVFGLTALVLWAALQGALPGAGRLDWVVVVAAVIYGLMTFIIVIEGQTAPIGIPFAALVGAWFAARWYRHRVDSSTLWFFGLAHLLAVLLFAGWWLYWGYLPEFSELGWI